MVEYMLVRQSDQPILASSRGALRWVVIDEAHTYIGSAAAEFSLLIRRVFEAFDVSAENVRFVATSATIGGEEDHESELRAFLADVAGLPQDRVRVVQGERSVPAVPPVSTHDGAEPEERRLWGLGYACRDQLATGPKTVAELSEAVGITRNEVLEILDRSSRDSWRGSVFYPSVPTFFNAHCQGCGPA